MKHHLTTTQASMILQMLHKIKIAGMKSPVMLAALDIDKHDIAKCEAVIKHLES